MESVEVETRGGWGFGVGWAGRWAKSLQMQKGKGYQTPNQTDKAIYLASQLSSMQLLSAK